MSFELLSTPPIYNILSRIKMPVLSLLCDRDFFSQMHRSKRAMLPDPSRELVNYVVGRFDPDPDAGEF